MRIRAFPFVALAAFVRLLPSSAADEARALVHPADPPKGVALPSDPHSWLYLEGETPPDDGVRDAASDALPDASHGPRTIFRARQSPDDRWWGRVRIYDGTRAAMRGSNADQPWHAIGWDIPADTLAPGEYEAWVRLFLAPEGAADILFEPDAGTRLTAGEPPPAAAGRQPPHAPTAGPGISWTMAGRFNVPGTPQKNGAPLFPALRVRTRKSAVCVDCVLLARVDPDTRRADFRFDPEDGTRPDWRRGEGLVFATDQAVLAFADEGASPVRSAHAAIRRSPDPAATPETRQLTPDSDRPGRWTLVLPEPGWYDIAVTAEPERGLPAEIPLRAAVVGAPIPEEWREHSVFGIWTVHGDPALIRLAGARWNRSMTSFRDVTREEAETIGRQDVPADSASAHAPYAERDGLRNVGVFSFGMPLWAMEVPEGAKMPSFGNPFYPASDWDAVSRAVTAFARTHDLPRDFAMYNEPLAHFKGAPAQLADYARAVRAGLKAADPSFRIGGPGLYSIRTGDLEKIESGGLLDALDFLEMHAYVGGTPPEGEFFEKIVGLNDWLAGHGRAGMPVFLTEFGWTAADGTWQPPVDRLTQTRYVARSLALAWSQRIAALVYFALDYRTGNTGEAAFSLVDGDGRPEAGYSAFAAVSRHFAGSSPLGHWMLAPGTHLVAGTRAGRIQLALWGETDGLPPVRLPWRTDTAKGPYGAPRPLAETFAPTPDPLYLEAPLDAPLPSLRTLPALRGRTPPALILAGTNAMWAAECMAFYADQGEDDDCADGEYAAFVTAPDGTRFVQPFQLVPALRLVSAMLAWPADADAPRLDVGIERNGLGGAIEFALAVTLDGNLSGKSLFRDANEGTEGVFTVPLAMPATPVHGRRMRGFAEILDHGQPSRLLQVDCTVLAVWPKGADAPWADFTEWSPYGWATGKTPPDEVGEGVQDCVARVRLFHSREGLLAEVEVEDDEHVQDCAASDPSRLWSQDSLQFGFDLDWGKPWEAGFAGAGNSQTLGGHRVFEFSVAGAGDDSPGVAYLERSYDESLPAGSVRPAVRADVARAGGVTRYSVLFPWDQIGAPEGTPAPGTAIGISIAVNDIDPARGAARRALRLFGGIVDEKDAANYGPAWIRPEP